MSNTSSSSITALVPGGVVTTQNISTVIKPKENNNSMQFVKIQTPELSKSAAEQIRVAEESKISKNKIKEVEEEWQSNLLNWKSKRRQQFVGTHPNGNEDEQNNNGQENGRKIKTFAEMIEQRAKTGNRINFHLQRYIGSDDSEHSQDGEESSDRNNAEVEENNDHSNLLNDLDLRDREEALADANADKINRSTQEELLPANKLPPRPSRRAGKAESQYPTEDARQVVNLDNQIHRRDHDREEEDDDEDEDEEDQEEEEEQKQLQRIAFVAKLKAFERMTQPSMEEAKFTPTRAPRQPSHSPAMIQSKTSLDISPIAPQNNDHILNSNSKQSSSPKSTLQLQHPSNSTPLQSMITISPPPRQQSSNIIPSHDSPPEPPIQQRLPLIPPIAPNLQSNPQPKLPPQRQQPSVHRHPVQSRQSQQHQISPAVPQQPSHPHQTQQHSQREDKHQDRTVLSVSGKKRCSSCKEELGRGAAAFVIESLNLVYHTNCFRCSVCHVNLSNGFRGVDVRVHAGALHCQNCYSKDGLNYSRV